MQSAISIKIDNKTQECIEELAKVRRQSSKAILREAIEQYLERNEDRTQQDVHPSGKPWPQRSPIGGIITPL
jgi:predicted transcriptional regulator